MRDAKEVHMRLEAVIPAHLVIIIIINPGEMARNLTPNLEDQCALDLLRIFEVIGDSPFIPLPFAS